MERLSKLQRWILEHAANYRHRYGIQCLIADVLQSYYGIQSNNRYSKGNPSPGEHNFRGLSESEYKKILAARAAVSRAFKTLQDKGLVEIRSIKGDRASGVNITDKGRLTVNIQNPLSHNVNSYDSEELTRLEGIISKCST